MKKVIRIYLRDLYEAGLTDHPKKEVEKLGMKVLKFEGVPIADCVFMEVENVPENLPKYIELSDHKII